MLLTSFTTVTGETRRTSTLERRLALTSTATTRTYSYIHRKTYKQTQKQTDRQVNKYEKVSK